MWYRRCGGASVELDIYERRTDTIAHTPVTTDRSPAIAHTPVTADRSPASYGPSVCPSTAPGTRRNCCWPRVGSWKKRRRPCCHPPPPARYCRACSRSAGRPCARSRSRHPGGVRPLHGWVRRSCKAALCRRSSVWVGWAMRVVGWAMRGVGWAMQAGSPSGRGCGVSSDWRNFARNFEFGFKVGWITQDRCGRIVDSSTIVVSCA